MPCPRCDLNRTITVVELIPPDLIVANAPLPFVF